MIRLAPSPPVCLYTFNYCEWPGALRLGDTAASET